MSMPCPPAPNYIREQGIADCDYLQATPFARQRMQAQFDQARRPYFDPNNNKTYSIGGLPMQHPHMGAAPRVFGLHGHHGHMGAAPRVFGLHGHHGHMGAAPRVFGLGRSVLDVSKAQNFNRGSNAIKPRSVGNYGNTSSDLFIKHLWTAQVIALWVTDGKVYRDYKGMEGIVTRNGHNPRDISKLNIDSNGVARTDLRSLLNPSNDSSVTFVKGPDGMFGPGAESLIEEFAGTGKIFGVSLPTPPSGRQPLEVYASLVMLGLNIDTPKITAARTKYEAGNPPPSRREPVKTPCGMLQDDARAARPDCPPINGGGGGGGGKRPPKPVPKPPKKPAQAAEEIDWLLWGSVAAGVCLIGGVGYWYYNRNNV